MRRALSDQEVQTLVDIAIRHAGDTSPLVGALRDASVTDGQEAELLELVTDELAAHGFDAAYEPSANGIELENLIDVLNDV
jgi:hypothetical protein